MKWVDVSTSKLALAREPVSGKKINNREIAIKRETHFDITY